MRMAFDIDVRDVVPAINVPTLIVHAARDGVCHVENARFLAREHPRCAVRGARPTTTMSLVRPRRRRSPRSGSSSPGSARRRRPIGSWRRSCSRTSSARPSAPQSSATAAGAICSSSTMRRAARARPLRRARGGHGGRRVLRDVRRPGARDPLRRGDRRRRASRSASTSGPDCTRARSSSHDGKVAGIAVNIGARVAAQAGGARCSSRSTVEDLVAGSGLDFEDRGTARAQGRPRRVARSSPWRASARA